ncbi:hypothetical protein GGS21DRAFT_110393 [Xylaria nigripes]|nr:hypothetical protein GGS21DRAFT_110393 [Xylaria nigripes]
MNQANRTSENNLSSEWVTVQIPDLFVSCVSETPKINKFDKETKAESEAWISESTCSYLFAKRYTLLVRQENVRYVAQA